MVALGTTVRVEVRPEILVDRTKVGDAILEQGAAVTVVVLDDSRIPMRGSLLIADRKLRDGSVVHDQNGYNDETQQCLVYSAQATGR